MAIIVNLYYYYYSSKKSRIGRECLLATLIAASIWSECAPYCAPYCAPRLRVYDAIIQAADGIDSTWHGGEIRTGIHE